MRWHHRLRGFHCHCSLRSALPTVSRGYPRLNQTDSLYGTGIAQDRGANGFTLLLQPLSAPSYGLLSFPCFLAGSGLRLSAFHVPVLLTSVGKRTNPLVGVLSALSGQPISISPASVPDPFWADWRPTAQGCARANSITVRERLSLLLVPHQFKTWA